MVFDIVCVLFAAFYGVKGFDFGAASLEIVSVRAGLIMSSVKMVLTLCFLQKSMMSASLAGDGSPDANASSTLACVRPKSRQR